MTHQAPISEPPTSRQYLHFKGASMNTVQSKDGSIIAFDQYGQGPALILVAGALQHRTLDQQTAQLAQQLAAHFTVYHYDRRGRGNSGDTAPYAVERELEDLEAVIDAAGGSALVFGHSSGAVLALEAAKALETKISKLALYEPPFVVDDSRPPRSSDYVAQLEQLVAAGQRGDAVALMMTDAAGVPAEYVAPMRDQPFWADFEAVAHTLAYDGRIMGETMSGQPLPQERWRDVTQPTLVLDGGASFPYMHSAAGALAKLLPNAQRGTLEGQDHGPAPEVLAPALEAFFQG
jgi:pimeloyl-ACP methyl ester carboxylesterase